MKAAFCLGSGKFDVHETARPDLRPGEALVRVVAAGICGSDKWDLSRPGIASRVAGHEFAGVVEAVADGKTDLLPGAAVAVEPTVGCGDCAACRGGNYTACRRAVSIGYGRPGGFAEYVAVPFGNLFPKPAALSFVEVSLAEPTAVALHAVGLAEVADRICIVFGAGAIGLLVAQALQVRGAGAVWVVDVDADHLRVAEQLGGIKTVNNAADPDLRVLQNVPVDVCFEAVGHFDSVLQAAVKLVRPFGTLVLLGFGHPGGLPTSPVVFKSLTVRGSNGRTLGEFQEGLRLLASGHMRVGPLISARYPLGAMEAAFAEARGALKVVVEPQTIQ